MFNYICLGTNDLRRAAGWGLFALTIAVTPANIDMLQHAEAFRIPYWLLLLRLPVQPALLILIVWSTTPSCVASPAPTS